MTNETKSILPFSAIPVKEMTTQMDKLLTSYSISWLDWGKCNSLLQIRVHHACLQDVPSV